METSFSTTVDLNFRHIKCHGCQKAFRTNCPFQSTVISRMDEQIGRRRVEESGHSCQRSLSELKVKKRAEGIGNGLGLKMSFFETSTQQHWNCQSACVTWNIHNKGLEFLCISYLFEDCNLLHMVTRSSTDGDLIFYTWRFNLLQMWSALSPFFFFFLQEITC